MEKLKIAGLVVCFFILFGWIVLFAPWALFIGN